MEDSVKAPLTGSTSLCDESDRGKPPDERGGRAAAPGGFIVVEIPLNAAVYFSDDISDDDDSENAYDNVASPSADKDRYYNNLPPLLPPSSLRISRRPTSSCFGYDGRRKMLPIQFYQECQDSSAGKRSTRHRCTHRRCSLAAEQASGSLMGPEKTNAQNNQIAVESIAGRSDFSSVSKQREASGARKETRYAGMKYKIKTLNGFLFGPVIGEGSYSKVKECINTKTLCRHAVKIMKYRQLRRVPNGEEIARREIEVLKRLPQHENIVRLHSVYEDKLVKQKIYVFLDLAVCSLQELLDDYGRPFPAWQLHRYFVQLVAGVEFLHANQVVHNDLKPGNLLLTADQVIKICDFGSAELLDPFDQRGRCKRCRGTPAFQAPEVANGLDDYDARKLDIWSAGVCLYNLSIGELPFKADNVYLMFKVVGRGQYQIPDHVDTCLRNLLEGMMCVDVGRRFTLSQVKCSEWFRKKHPLTLPDAIPGRSKASVDRGPFPMLPYLAEAAMLNADVDADTGDEPDTFAFSLDRARQQQNADELTSRDKIAGKQNRHRASTFSTSVFLPGTSLFSAPARRRKSQACRVT